MIKPILNNILVSELRPTKEGGIIIPESAESKYFYGAIIRLGETVKDQTIKEGMVCLFKRTAAIRHKGYVLFKEHDIILVFHMNIWRPLGNKVLLQRQIGERMVGKIIVPACWTTQDQTLDCVMLLRGIKDNELIYIDLFCGDKVRLKRWDMSIDEIDLDGRYVLSCSIDLLSHKEEEFKPSEV